jgi:hypothetical protein
MRIRFSIYLASKTRWAHLSKIVDLLAIPRVGEYVKFSNTELGDYFPWRVVEVTHREDAEVEIQTDLLNDVDGRGYSFEEESEFEEYFESYVKAGWSCSRGPQPNRRVAGSAVIRPA